MPDITLSVRNFRCLREAHWEIPEGISALVGPNGSGKTTLLSALSFLGNLLEGDFAKTIQAAGGLLGLRHFDAPPEEFLELDVTIGDLHWKISIPFDGPNPVPLFGESVTFKTVAVLDFQPSAIVGAIEGEQIKRRAGSSALLQTGNSLHGVTVSDEVIFFTLLGRIASYTQRRALAYDIDYLRRSGSSADSDTALSPDGRSVWSVLRNWRDKRETRPRYDFVLASMRDAFPQHFDDLDFEFTAQQVSARVYVPGRSTSMPHHLFSDGWFTGLLHLCAVASAQPGSILSIDEPENSLHPHGIRSLLRSIGSWADQNQLSIVLATHSPVVLNQIKDRARVFVTEPGHARFPVPLDEHPNHEWLSHFSIGDAYANEEVGAPPLPK